MPISLAFGNSTPSAAAVAVANAGYGVVVRVLSAYVGDARAVVVVLHAVSVSRLAPGHNVDFGPLEPVPNSHVLAGTEPDLHLRVLVWCQVVIAPVVNAIVEEQQRVGLLLTVKVVKLDPAITIPDLELHPVRAGVEVFLFEDVHGLLCYLNPRYSRHPVRPVTP